MGFVYVIQTDDGRVKIGRSINPEKRIKSIEWKVKRKVTQSYVSPDFGNYGDIENALLKKFRDEDSEGEWVAHAFDDVVFSAESLVIEIGSNDFPSKTSIILKIDSELWKQFIGLAALKKKDRQDLLEEAIKAKILKEAGR